MKQNGSRKNEYQNAGEKKRREGDNMAAVCAAWSLLCLVCMAGMLLFAANKAIVIADVSKDPSGMSVNAAQQGDDKRLVLQEDGRLKGAFVIPLPRGIKAENITMENRYVSRELLLHIQGADEGFYVENHIGGDISPALSARYEVQEDGVLLRIHMSRVLEYESTMDGSGLTISWHEPWALYDWIVVLDPAGGGSETGISNYGLTEKDLTLQLAKQIQKKLELQNVRLYCTRSEDVDISEEERARLAEEVGADLYIRLCAGADAENAEVYGITGYYNEDYYIPGFGNVTLADILTREVTIAAGNRAVGLRTAGEESVLRRLKMPAAEISVGFLSHPKEEYLLGQESYQAKLADGFVSAITKAVDALEAEALKASEEGR